MKKWTHESSSDTGNGAMIHRSRHPGHPNIIRYEFHSYCGREKDGTWYEIAGDPKHKHYSTVVRAERAMPAVHWTEAVTH